MLFWRVAACYTCLGGRRAAARRRSVCNRALGTDVTHHTARLVSRCPPPARSHARQQVPGNLVKEVIMEGSGTAPAKGASA